VELAIWEFRYGGPELSSEALRHIERCESCAANVCGDGVCEAARGETECNCPADCSGAGICSGCAAVVPGRARPGPPCDLSKSSPEQVTFAPYFLLGSTRDGPTLTKRLYHLESFTMIRDLLDLAAAQRLEDQAALPDHDQHDDERAAKQYTGYHGALSRPIGYGQAASQHNENENA
jgi:hypothetical protein